MDVLSSPEKDLNDSVWVGIPALYCLVVAQILVNKAGRADPWEGLKGVATSTDYGKLKDTEKALCKF